MNHVQRRHEMWRRHLLTTLAAMDEFTLGEAWKACGWLRYGWVSRTLLEWWREGDLLERQRRDGTWVRGYPWSDVSRKAAAVWPHETRYRWIDP